MLTIGLLGCGVVGSGVMNLIDDPASDVCRNMRIKHKQMQFFFAGLPVPYRKRMIQESQRTMKTF